MSRRIAIAAALALVAAAALMFALRDGKDETSRARARGLTPAGIAPPSSTSEPPLPAGDAPLPGVATTAASAIDLAEGEGALRGIVFAPDGEPAPGAEVTLYRSRLPAEVEEEGGLSIFRVLALPGESGEGSRELAADFDLPFRPEIARGLSSVASVRADAEGSYAFTGLATGRYLPAARAAGSLETPSPAIRAIAGVEMRVDLRTVAEGEITGTVLGEDGSPIAGARIQARGEVVPFDPGMPAAFLTREEILLYLLNPPTGAAASAEDGSFRIAALPPLEYRLYVDAVPWAAAELRHDVPETAPAQVVLVPGGSIEGIVVDPAGGPVSGVSVALSLDEGGSHPIEALLHPLPSALTDEEGRFRFEGLAEAGYRADAAAAGWRGNAARGLTVAPGDATAVEIVLTPGGWIEGVVRDAEGNGVAEATVEAHPVGSRSGRIASVRTDAEGAFRLDTLPEGSFLLRATKEGFLTAEAEASTGGSPVMITLAPGVDVTGRVVDAAREPVERARISVERGWEAVVIAESDGDGRFAARLSEDTAIRLRVRAAGFAEEGIEAPDGGGDLGEIVLAEPARLEGIVLDPAGAPHPGVRVTATRQSGSGPRVPGDAPRPPPRVSSAWSDEEGRFSLEVDDHAGVYTVSAHAAFLLPSAAETVDAGSAASLRLVLRLRYGAVIEGVVTGIGSSPVDGAVVELREVRPPGRSGGTRRVVRTSGGGNFLIAGLEAGSYVLRASAVRHAQAAIPGIELASDESRGVEVRLDPEQRLEGSVIDDRGAPIDSARIGVAEAGGARRSATSDRGGAFVVDRLGRGALDVTVEAPGFLRRRVTGVFAEAGPVEIELRTAYEIGGTVLDQGTETPLREARVLVRPAGSGQDSGGREEWARTDAEGWFTLRNLDVGEYRLVVTAEGYIPFEVPEVRVPQLPSEEGLVVLLRAGARIRGVVHDGVGAPLPGVQVRAFRLSDEAAREDRPRRRRGQSMAQARSDESGEFALTGLPEGRYEVQFEHGEHLPQTETTLLSVDRPEPRLIVSLERGAELEGRVYGPTGMIEDQGTVILDGPVRRRAGIGEGGRYRFAGLPEGVYRVRFVLSRQSGEGSETVTVELRPRQERTLDLRG